MSEEMKHPVGEIMNLTMEKIKQMVDTDTMVGDPITVGDTTIIPISKISIGFASGGSDFSKKKPDANGNNFGGGAGGGISITPIVFLVVSNGSVHVLGVNSAPVTTVDRVIDMLPGVLDKVEGFIDKNKTGEVKPEYGIFYKNIGTARVNKREKDHQHDNNSCHALYPCACIGYQR